MCRRQLLYEPIIFRLANGEKVVRETNIIEPIKELCFSGTFTLVSCTGFILLIWIVNLYAGGR